jgi:phosphatidylglycerol:prolipoprotein diacylglycerol transferase
MRPVLFHIGSYPIYSYGVMLFLAFIVGIFVARYELDRRGQDGSAIYLIGAVAAIAGIVGARIFYVVGHWDVFSHSLGTIFDFNMRGLVFYGGLFLGIPACIIVVRRMKMPLGPVADSVGLALPLGIAIARVGCFLNGCCYGKPSGLPWAVTFPGMTTPVHPTQLYEMILDLGAFTFLLLVRKRVYRDWDLFLLSLAAYGLIRFTVEFFREHLNSLGQPNPAAGIFFQVLSMALVAGSLTIFYLRERGAKPPAEIAVED